MRRRTRAVVMAIAGIALACGGDRTIIDPPPPGSKNATVAIIPHKDDATVAAQLGWSSGVPGAEITLTPADGDGPAQTLTSGATGTATLPQLTEGKKYLLSVRRVLTAQELTKLGAANDVFGFAGFDTVSTASATAALTFPVAASRRGALAISEWSFISKFELGWGNYDAGGFLEVYNNSDTTVYLDGLIFGVGFAFPYDLPDYSCGMFEPLRTDPAMIWSLFHEAFPGGGRDYPLTPGKVAVVAYSAIDHSVYSPGLLDLRSANFELAVSAGVDNPGVPNMISLSVESPPFGQYFSSLGAVTFLASAGAVLDLPRQKDPRSSRLWRGFPASRIMDVFATASQYKPAYSRCPRMLHENIDRLHGVFLPVGPDDYLTSVSRKSFLKVGGSSLLQDTRSSAADFSAGSRTPGQVP